MRRLVPFLRRFDNIQMVKLRKIGKKPKNFRKNLVFEANKIALAENFWNLLTWPERASSCGSVFEILNCLGEIGLEKKSRNFYKCRGMSGFGEKKFDANNKAPRFGRRLKNFTIWASRKTRAPKTEGATACRAWARAETFNGLQKVLHLLNVPGPQPCELIQSQMRIF